MCVCRTYVQMGCVTIDGVMYSMRPYVRGAISRTPYPPNVEDVDYGDDTYRLIPVDLSLNFDDDEPPSRTSKSYCSPCNAITILQTNDISTTNIYEHYF